MLKSFALSLKAALTKLTKNIKYTKFIKNAGTDDLSSAELSQSETDGKILRLWNWTLPAALGLTAGWFCATCLGVWLEGVNGRSRPLTWESDMAAPDQETRQGGMIAFLRTNPFNVTPMAAPAEPEHDAPTPITGSLAAAILKGTSPGYIAWMEDQGKLKLVMLGDSFDVYTLEEVTYMDATFVNGGSRVVKEIVYRSGGQPAPQPAAQLPSAAGTDFTGQIAPPGPSGGVPGVIDRDVINHLLENPFEELKKVRIRPATDGQGLQVEWIVQDSILAQLGVKEGDVVHAVNGIAFRNAMDVNNALSSLIASDQFIVDVVRGGSPTKLSYEVR